RRPFERHDAVQAARKEKPARCPPFLRGGESPPLNLGAGHLIGSQNCPRQSRESVDGRPLGRGLCSPGPGREKAHVLKYWRRRRRRSSRKVSRADGQANKETASEHDLPMCPQECGGPTYGNSSERSPCGPTMSVTFRFA